MDYIQQAREMLAVEIGAQVTAGSFAGTLPFVVHADAALRGIAAARPQEASAARRERPLESTNQRRPGGAGRSTALSQPITTTQPEVLLTLRDVSAQAGVQSSFIYERMKTKQFPKSIRVGRRALWLQSEVQAWIQDQVAKNRQAQPDG